MAAATSQVARPIFLVSTLCYLLVRKPILKESSGARQRFCSRLAFSCWHQLSTRRLPSGWSELGGHDTSQRDTAGAQWHGIANQVHGGRRTLSRTEVSRPDAMIKSDATKAYCHAIPARCEQESDGRCILCVIHLQAAGCP
jgi:hypothetical protein